MPRDMHLPQVQSKSSRSHIREYEWKLTPNERKIVERYPMECVTASKVSADAKSAFL